jgi:hypothetical protein
VQYLVIVATSSVRCNLNVQRLRSGSLPIVT